MTEKQFVDTNFPEVGTNGRLEVVMLPDGTECPAGSVMLAVTPESVRVFRAGVPTRVRCGVAEREHKVYLIRKSSSAPVGAVGRWAIQQRSGTYLVFEGPARDVADGETYVLIGGDARLGHEPFTVLKNGTGKPIPHAETNAPVVRVPQFSLIGVLAVPPADAVVIEMIGLEKS